MILGVWCDKRLGLVSYEIENLQGAFEDLDGEIKGG